MIELEYETWKLDEEYLHGVQREIIDIITEKEGPDTQYGLLIKICLGGTRCIPMKGIRVASMVSFSRKKIRAHRSQKISRLHQVIGGLTGVRLEKVLSSLMSLRLKGSRCLKKINMGDISAIYLNL